MTTKLMKKYEQSKKFKEIKTIKKNKTEILELKSITTSMKNSIQTVKNRQSQAEEGFSEFEDHLKLPTWNNKNNKE